MNKTSTLFTCDWCKCQVSRMRYVDGYWLCIKYGCAKPIEKKEEDSLDPWDPWKTKRKQ